MNSIDRFFSLQSLDQSLSEISEAQDLPRTPVKQIKPSNIEDYLREKELELNSHPMNFISIYHIYHDPLVLAFGKKNNQSADSVEYVGDVEDFRQKKEQHNNAMNQKKNCIKAKNEHKKRNQFVDLSSVSTIIDFSL